MLLASNLYMFFLCMQAVFDLTGMQQKDQCVTSTDISFKVQGGLTAGGASSTDVSHLSASQSYPPGKPHRPPS